MSEQAQLSFNIPKIKRQLSKDNIRNVAITSRDSVELLQSVDRCYLDQDVKGEWEVKSIQMFDNRNLEKSYREKRTDLKDNGRHVRELTEQYGFLFIKDTHVIVPAIAKHGLRTKAGTFNGLGDSKSGVYVSKHPDVQLKIAENKDDRTAFICVFKLTLGRCKAQQISNSSDNPIEPTPNFDSHVSTIVTQVNTLHSVQLQRSQVYLYEYTDEALPSERPRHCLPYALLQYEKTKSSSSAYSRSAYGSKSTSIDYARKPGQPAGSTQRKSRGEESTVRRSSYESGPSYSRQDSQPGVPKPGREDPRIARKRNSTEGPIDSRLISDSRLSGIDPRASTIDPRFKANDTRKDPRMLGDPRLTQSDPQAVPRNLVIPSNQFTPNDPRTDQPEQKMVSPEMKSMIKTVSQLWGTTLQSEMAIVNEDQSDNSIVKQVQEQMDQKRAEKKKISLADYSKTRKKPNTVPIPTIPVTAVDVLTSVSSSSDSVSSANVNTSSTSIANEIYPPSRFSIAKSPTAIVHYSPSVGASVTPAYAPEATMLSSGAITVPPVLSSVPTPFPAPEPEFSSLPSSYPVSPPSIITYVPTTPSPVYDSEHDLNDVSFDSIQESLDYNAILTDSDESVGMSSPVQPSMELYNETKDEECWSSRMGEHSATFTALPYSPKGTFGYSDPYAAVKRQSVQSDISLPESLLEKHPADVDLFTSECAKGPRNEDVMYDPFEQDMKTSCNSDTFQSPVVPDFMESPVTDDIQDPIMYSSLSEYHPSPVTCPPSPFYQCEYQSSRLEPNSRDMSDSQSHYQPSPIKSRSAPDCQLAYQPSPTKLEVHDNPFSFLKLNKPMSPVIKHSPLSIPSSASILPESLSTESVSSQALLQQQSGPLLSNPAEQAPTSSQAYVSNLVSKFQSINPGDFKDIITKMKSLQSQTMSTQSETYRDLGTNEQHFSSNDPRPGLRDDRGDHCDSSPRDSDSRRSDSWRSSARDVDSYRDSRYTNARSESYSRSSYRYREEERRRRPRHDDYWGRHEDDVDYRRRDRRRKYDDDDRDHRDRDSRYDRRSNTRRNSPRQDDASRYGDLDLRRSRYNSPRRPERIPYMDEEKTIKHEKIKESSDDEKQTHVNELKSSDLYNSNKRGNVIDIVEKFEDLSEGVWMAPKLDASDPEMTPVKSSPPDEGHHPVHITSEIQKKLVDKSDKTLLFDEKDSHCKSSDHGSLSERGNVFSTLFGLSGSSTPPHPTSKEALGESPRVNQARSWAEVMDEDDKKVPFQGNDNSEMKLEQLVEDDAFVQEKSLQTKSGLESESMNFSDKRGKKRKLAKDMAGYTRRKKRGRRGRGRKGRLNKVMDEDEKQKAWSPGPDDTSVQYDQDEPDYYDFSFDQPHLYVETMPNSDDDDQSFVTESMSVTSRTASPTNEFLSHLGLAHLDKSDLLPTLELVDFLKMPVASCKLCCQCSETIGPFLQNVILSEEEGDNDPEEEIDELDVKGTEYYTKNCLPGLDLILPPEEQKLEVKQEIKTEKNIIIEEKTHDSDDIKPVVKEERLEEKTIGYNSCEGDKPLHLKLQLTPTKAGRTEEDDCKVTKPITKPKFTEDGELDINGTHNTFSPMKGLVKRKLSITLCIGGKKKKAHAIAEAAAIPGTSTPPVAISSSHPSASTTPASVPVTVTPLAGRVATAVPPLPTVATRCAPTIQYKIGVKKSVKLLPTTAPEGKLETGDSAMPISFPVKRSGQSIPVLGMSWSAPQTSVQLRSNENVITTSSHSCASTEWSSIRQNSPLMGEPLVSASIPALQPRPLMLPTQLVGIGGEAYPHLVRSELGQSNIDIRPPASSQAAVIPRYTQHTPISTMVRQPTPMPAMVPQPTPIPTMVPQPTPIPTMVPQPTPIPTMVPPPSTRLQLPNYGYPQPPSQHPHQSVQCGIAPISQQVPIASQHSGPLQSLPIRLLQPPIPSVRQQIPILSQRMPVSQQVQGMLQRQPSLSQGLTTHSGPSLGQQLPLVIMRPQTPIPSLQAMNTTYPQSSICGSNLNQSQYGYPQAAAHTMTTQPPLRGFGIPVLGQKNQGAFQQPGPVPLGQSYNPPMFNPIQPPMPVRQSRPSSTLIQVHTPDPPLHPDVKKSTDPADWFADMFAPKKRETSWSKESTPESGLFAGLDKVGAGSGPSETSSVASSPISQFPFLGESSRGVFSGEMMHSGKDIKATNTPMFLKSLVHRVGNDRSRSVTPEQNYSETNSTSPYSDVQSISERNTPSPSFGSQGKELDILSQERAKILHALQNLDASGSDGEESEEEGPEERKTETKMEVPVYTRDPENVATDSEHKETDVRRVQFQRKVETTTNDDPPRDRMRQAHGDYNANEGDDMTCTIGNRDKKPDKENQASKKRVSFSIASKWSDYLQYKDKRCVKIRGREPVDYRDELDLYKCDQNLPDTMDNTPDDSSSVSGDSIEDLEELSIKLNYETSRAVGRVQDIPLTIELYLKHKLFVSDPNKVRDKFPWPLNTILTEQTKNKRRRMVQKAKIVASHFAKKQSKGEEETHGKTWSSCKVHEEDGSAEPRLEDFTKEQILMELQIVQECILKCSTAGEYRKDNGQNIGQLVDTQNSKQLIGNHIMASQTCPNPSPVQQPISSVEQNIQNVRENVLDMERAKNLGITVVQFQQMKAQNMKRQIMMNNPSPQFGNHGMKQLQMIDSPMSNPRVNNNPQMVVFEKLKDIQMKKLQKIQMMNTEIYNPSNMMLGKNQCENTENEDMDANFDQMDERNEVLEQYTGSLNHEKGALQQIARDLMEGFQKLSCFGRSHQKVPDDILLQSEKKKYHSEEGVFLMLLSAISKKPYLRLLSMKVDLERLVKQKLEAATQNRTRTVMEARNKIVKLHEERKKLLTTFVGSLGKKRLRKLNVVKTKYQTGVAHLRRELGDDCWVRLQYVCTMYQTINTHVRIVQKELTSPTL